MTRPILEALAVSKSFALRDNGPRSGPKRFLQAVDQVSLALAAWRDSGHRRRVGLR